MVLKMRVLALTLILWMPSTLRAAEAPRPGEVLLPLKDYLALVETVERLDRERAQRLARREEPLAEVISQRLRIVLKEDTADVTSEFEVLVQGEPKGPVPLPIAGLPLEVEAKVLGAAPATAGPAAAGPAASVGAGAKEGELQLVAPGPGRYAVKVTGPLPAGKGVSRLTLPAVVAPVAVTEIDLPADRAFDAPGAVIVDDRTEGGRRRIQLTTSRGEAQTVEVRRKVDGGEADKLLAQSVVLTLVQLLPDGPRRHDVVLYKISRGGLGSFTVDLPPGLVVEQAGTDEGNVVPVMDSRRLTINRTNQLRGTGYLVLTSTPAPGAEVPLEPIVPVMPEIEVRTRYLALASAVAADAHPLPQASWTRVDLDDLPPALREALSSIDLAAAWRLSGAPGGGKMAVALQPLAPSLPLLIERRETTTLLTVDGTLLHRDRLTLRPPGGLGAALDVILPAAAKLWSAKVDEVPVRPLVRGNGTISIPLGFETGKEPVIEIVSVLEKAIPAGRSELALTLPQIAVPVQVHEWRVLLPDGPKYRFRSGELRPAAVSNPPQATAAQLPGARDPWAVLRSAPGVLTDRINVGGNESGQQSSYRPSYVRPDSAAILGKVMDDKGQALPGATVTLTGAKNPSVQVTDAQGAFAFRGLPAGTFNVKAELEGFSPFEARDFRLGTGQTASPELRLSAATADVITVTAESPLIDQRRISTGATLSNAELEKITTSRDPWKGLQQGLVGGVKPLPVAIPESGKVLYLTGVLPPAKVGVELEVKGKR